MRPVRPVRRKGLPNWRIVRYADDFVVLVHGERCDVEYLRDEIVEVLAVLRLSEAKTRVAHMNESFDFLGFRMVVADRNLGGH
jgi:RNA-directed DNA polymerase